VSSSGKKIRYVCPVCEKVYKVPVSKADAPCCGPCAKEEAEREAEQEELRRLLDEEREAEAARVQAELEADRLEAEKEAEAAKVKREEHELRVKAFKRKKRTKDQDALLAPWAEPPEKANTAPEYKRLDNIAGVFSVLSWICLTFAALLVLHAVILGGKSEYRGGGEEAMLRSFGNALWLGVYGGGLFVASELVWAFRDVVRNSWKSYQKP